MEDGLNSRSPADLQHWRIGPRIGELDRPCKVKYVVVPTLGPTVGGENSKAPPARGKFCCFRTSIHEYCAYEWRYTAYGYVSVVISHISAEEASPDPSQWTVMRSPELVVNTADPWVLLYATQYYRVLYKFC